MAKKRKANLKIDTTNTTVGSEELPQTLGDFLKVSDVKDGEVVEIKSPAYILSSKYGLSRVVSVDFHGSRKLLRLNKFSLRNLVDAFGANSADWVGKRVLLRRVKIANLDAVVVEAENVAI